MPTRILYIDDQIDSRTERLQMRLARSPEIECELVAPRKLSDIGKVVKGEYDLFLVDQDLTTRVSYYGSTLVAEIRTRYPDHPIVIITRKTVLRDLGSETSRQLTSEMQIFDDLILKSMLDDQLVETQQRLVILSEGFRVLRENKGRTWKQLVRALAATTEEEDLLREAAPPLQRGSWTVTGAAHWVRDIILRYPGILDAPVHAATRLGISEESFNREEVQNEMKETVYDGIFAPPEGRWWRERLLGRALEFTSEQEVDGTVNKVFAEAIKKKYRIDLQLAECVWDGKPIADRVCYILNVPVKIEHSLRYYPDNRPSVMDQARVSFRAIQESKIEEELLDSKSRELLKKIQDLPDPKKRAA